MGSPISAARERLFAAATVAGVSPEFCATLRYPRETIVASLPFRRGEVALAARRLADAICAKGAVVYAD